MIQHQNSVPTLEQQISSEFGNIANLLQNMTVKKLKEVNSAFEKLDTLLHELKRQKKNFVWQQLLQQIDQSVQNLKSVNGIDDLTYTRFTTFIHNLQNFSKINEKDWNSRSMFYTEVDDNGKFHPVQNGLQNIGATCFMNAVLQAMYNFPLFYDFILRWKKCIDASRGDMFNQQSLQSYQMKEPNAVCMWQLLVLFSSLCNSYQEKYINPTNFRNSLEQANSLFKASQSGDSKDFIIYILEYLHKIMQKPAPAFSGQSMSRNQLNQYDKQSALSYFFLDFQKETSTISDNFYGVHETTSTCLHCKNKYNQQGLQDPVLYNYQIFNFLIFPLEEIKKFKQNKEGLPPGSNPVVSIKDCFDYYEKIEHFTGENGRYCNWCKQVFDSDVQAKIVALPKTMFFILNRDRGNMYNVTIDYPLYLDCSDTGVMDEDQRYGFHGLNMMIRHLGKSMRPNEQQDGNAAHFISINKSPKDGKWYCHNDASVSMIGDGSDEAVLTDKSLIWNIKRSVQNYNSNDTVPYIGGYTEMTATNMLNYALGKVQNAVYREAMRNKFNSLQYFTNRGDENKKRFAYLLMYAVAERRTAKVNEPELTGLTEQEVSDLACATFEMLKHENNFLKPEKIRDVQNGRDGMDYYKSVINSEAQALKNSKTFPQGWSLEDIIGDINGLYCVGQNSQNGRLSEKITIAPNDFEYRDSYPVQQLQNQNQNQNMQNNFSNFNQNQINNNINFSNFNQNQNQNNNFNNNINFNNFNQNQNQNNNFNNNINNYLNNNNNINNYRNYNFNNKFNNNQNKHQPKQQQNQLQQQQQQPKQQNIKNITVKEWIEGSSNAYKFKLSEDQKKRLEEHIVNNGEKDEKLPSSKYYENYQWILDMLSGKEGKELKDQLNEISNMFTNSNSKAENKGAEHESNRNNNLNNNANKNDNKNINKNNAKNNNIINNIINKNNANQTDNKNINTNANNDDKTKTTITNKDKDNKNNKDDKKDKNINDNDDKTKTEEETKIQENPKNKKNNIKTTNTGNPETCIKEIAQTSKSFAVFCKELTKENKNIDLNELDFGEVKLGFWNCVFAFFLTLFDRTDVNCGFWKLVFLRVFYENAHSKGKSYCFVAYQESDESSQNSNEPQYEKNIKCLSKLLNDARQNSQSQKTVIKNNSEVKG